MRVRHNFDAERMRQHSQWHGLDKRVRARADPVVFLLQAKHYGARRATSDDNSLLERDGAKFWRSGGRREGAREPKQVHLVGWSCPSPCNVAGLSRRGGLERIDMMSGVRTWVTAGQGRSAPTRVHATIGLGRLLGRGGRKRIVFFFFVYCLWHNFYMYLLGFS